MRKKILQPSLEANHAGTLTSNSSLQNCEKYVLLFKPPVYGIFVAAARADLDTEGVSASGISEGWDWDPTSKPLMVEGTKDLEDGGSQRVASLSLLDKSVPSLEKGNWAQDNSEHPTGPRCEGQPPPQTQLQTHRGNTHAL